MQGGKYLANTPSLKNKLRIEFSAGRIPFFMVPQIFITFSSILPIEASFVPTCKIIKLTSDLDLGLGSTFGGGRTSVNNAFDNFEAFIPGYE